MRLLLPDGSNFGRDCAAGSWLFGGGGFKSGFLFGGGPPKKKKKSKKKKKAKVEVKDEPEFIKAKNPKSKSPLRILTYVSFRESPCV